MMDTIKTGSSMNVLTPRRRQSRFSQNVPCAAIIDEEIEKHIEEFTPPALRTPEAVLEVLEQIRSDGYYISIGERKHPR